MLKGNDMSKSPDTVVKLSKTLTLCGYKTGVYLGFWLYDETRGMHLSMRAKTDTDAFTEALTYYQKRLAEVETSYRSLTSKVDIFVAQFIEEDE